MKSSPARHLREIILSNLEYPPQPRRFRLAGIILHELA